MKRRLTFKTPDVYDQLNETCTEAELEEFSDLLVDFVLYGEYITIELDSEAQTATVVPVN